jgi:hypothetical protein
MYLAGLYSNLYYMKKLLLFLSAMPLLAFAQAVLPTSWNFSDPGIANPPTGWSYDLGTGNTAYQSGVGDQVSLRLDQTGEYLQIHFAEKPGPVSYYIKGTGISPNPAFGGTFSVQESQDGSNWTDVNAFTAMTLTLTRYQHNLAAATRYVRFYYKEKQSGSNVQLDSVMIQTPPPPPQGIRLLSNNIQLVNGGTFAFGNATSTTFTVQNFGISSNLTIDSVTFDGANAADFSVGAFTTSIAANNGTGNIPVQFTAGANGSRLANMKVYSNDSERNPFVVSLYAIGGNLATEPSNQAASISINNVKAYTMDVTFTGTPSAEKYIVLRKEGGPVNEIPVDGVTYKRGDYIGGNQVAYIGTQPTTLKPTYIKANTDYSFAVFAYNGTEGYENYKTDVVVRQVVTTPANHTGNYYATINPNATSFITDLAARIRAPHDTVFYSNYAPTLVNNFLTRDTTEGRKVVNCVYTGIAYLYEDQFLWQASSNTTGILTREHTFAQSWMPTKTSLPNFPTVSGREVLEYNDLHHLFPADQNNANGVRSNHPFGIVVTPNSVSPTGFGKRGADYRNITVYEPKDDQKGNLARALFYMLVRYDGERNNQWRLPTNQEISVLLQWHQQDPPDAIEIARNEYIASIQHNRNPFIDYPQWVNRINFSNMTYVADQNPSTITVTAPTAGASLTTGVASTISWTSSNVDSVLVEVINNANSSTKTIGKYAASQSSTTYAFTDVSNASQIRVSSLTDASTFGFSGTFSVSGITLISPNGGENWANDNNYPYNYIVWKGSGVDSVKVELLVNDTIVKNLGTYASNKDSIQILGHELADFNTNAAKIKLTATNNTANAISAGTFIISKFMSVKENSFNSNQVVVYPVPSNGLVNIEVDGNIRIKQIDVYDVTGRNIQSSTQKELNIETKGIYFLHIHTNAGMAVKKVVIQ